MKSKHDENTTTTTTTTMNTNANVNMSCGVIVWRSTVAYPSGGDENKPADVRRPDADLPHGPFRHLRRQWKRALRETLEPRTRVHGEAIAVLQYCSVTVLQCYSVINNTV